MWRRRPGVVGPFAAVTDVQGGPALDGNRACAARFLVGCSIEDIQDAESRRHLVTHTESERAWALGAAELELARLFDGQRTYDEIRRVVAAKLGRMPSLEKICAFERRLVALGLLEATAAPDSISRDPFTGLNYSWIHRLIVVRFGSHDPDSFLDKILNRQPWLASRRALGGSLVVVLLAAVILIVHGHELVSAAAAVLSGWGWLGLYVSISLSSVAHEGGHALACKSFGVPVREVGLASYFLVPTAWTRPSQAIWARLPKRQRVATILAGPLGSLVWGACGVVLWWVSRFGAQTHDLGVVLAVAALFGTIPTLLPGLNGDGYMLLTQCLDLPELRTRSLQHLRARLRRNSKSHPQVDSRLGAVYLIYACTSLLCWIAIWISLALALVYLLMGWFQG